MLAVPGGALMIYSWGRALMIITPTQAAILLGFNPLTAMLLGALLIGEELTVQFIAGFLMVVGGGWAIFSKKKSNGKLDIFLMDFVSNLASQVHPKSIKKSIQNRIWSEKRVFIKNNTSPTRNTHV